MRAFHLCRLFPLLALAFLTGAAPPRNPGAVQQTPQAPFQETVVNIAAGRVFVAVTKGAILVGAVENTIEADTHLPVPVQIGNSQVGVLMGAVEWIAPASRQRMGRLDQELPHLRGRESLTGPHLGSATGAEATDLEAVGDGLFSRLNDLARNLHAKIDLPAGEPLALLIVADYAAGYGAEVWRIDYKFEQTEESADFWTTRVLRPSYVQFWPPEKGQPRTMLEFSYPPANGHTGGAATSLVDLWHQQDPRLKQIAGSDARLGEAAHGILQGESNKVPVADATQFFRAALDTITPRGTRETIAALGEESGFAWILPPPAEAPNPGLRPERPAGTPSLANPSH